jgi:IPTL-CTERM motif
MIESMLHKTASRGKFMSVVKSLLLVGLVGYASGSAAIDITGWTCTGSCGTSGANGVVTLSPFAGSSAYGWVSSMNGVNGLGLPGIGGTGAATNGSSIRSPTFSATGGQTLSFFFNYVTSDGAGFADYAWARLLDSGGSQVALLFTARTTTGGNTVPGFSMPVPVATLIPPSTPIIPGGPAWAPLGGSSGTCFDIGCGYTGWIQANYTVVTSGNYQLEFGVVNWNDTAFDSGMAFDGATIGGNPLGPGTTVTQVPTLNEYGLLAMIMLLGGLGIWQARRRSFRGK